MKKTIKPEEDQHKTNGDPCWCDPKIIHIEKKPSMLISKQYQTIAYQIDLEKKSGGIISYKIPTDDETEAVKLAMNKAFEENPNDSFRLFHLSILKVSPHF